MESVNGPHNFATLKILFHEFLRTTSTINAERLEPNPVTQKVCQWNAQNDKKYLQAWFVFLKLKKPNWDL